jgi:type II secretory pathway component PulC
MTPREIRFGLDGLTGIAVASVAAALALLTWTIAGYSSTASPVSAAARAYLPPSPAPDLTALVNLPPFGKATTTPASVAAGSGLVLHGILLTTPVAASTVLIAVPGQDPVSYPIGAVVPGGGTIDSVGEDFVLLRNGDQYVTLYFPDDPRARQPSAPGAPNAAPAPAPQLAPAIPGAGPSASGVDAIRALLPPSSVGAPVPRPVVPPPPPVSGQNSGNGNGLIDRPGGAVTPRQ